MKEEKIVRLPGTEPVDLPPLGEALIGASRLVAGAQGEKLCAYITIGIGTDGSYNFSWQYDADHPLLAPTVLRAMFGEIMSRELTTEAQILDFAQRHGWINK